MRLIDADYFKEQIAAATLKSNIEPNKGLALIEIVDAQPTAFDFESMIEQMEGKLECIRKEQIADCLMYDGHWTPEQSMRSGMIKAYLEILEVIKSGVNATTGCDEDE